MVTVTAGQEVVTLRNKETDLTLPVRKVCNGQ